MARVCPARALLRARSLRGYLLLVRAPDRCRRDRAADHAGDCDQREQVRERREERAVRRPGIDVLELRSESAREAEEECGPEGGERPPVAEDQRGEGDEPAPGRHVLRERVDEADRQEHASQGGQRSRGRHGRVPDAVDGDSDRVGSPRMLADRADAEADRGLEHDDVRDDQDGEADPDQEVEPAQRVVEKMAETVRRNVGEPVEVHVRDGGQVVGRAAVAVDVDVEIARDT